MRRHALATGILSLWLAAGVACAQAPSKPTVQLRRGLTIAGWFNPLAPAGLTPRQRDELKSVKVLGIDFVRLPVDPTPFWSSAVTWSQGASRLDAEITAIRDVGLNVVVDVHPTKDAKLEAIQSDGGTIRLIQFVRKLAQHLAGRNPEHVALELLNEPARPAGAPPEWSWSGISHRLWEAARAGAPRLTLILSGDDWSTSAGLLRVSPAPDHNVIYTIHVYDPMVFTHQGENWAGSARQYISGLTFPADAANIHEVQERALAKAKDPQTRAEIESELRDYANRSGSPEAVARLISAAADWAKAHQVSVMIGEFGALRNVAPSASRCSWLKTVRQAAEADSIPWSMWEIDHGFGIFAADGSVDTCVTTALGL